MKASECSVEMTYKTVVNGQVVEVKRYEPTKADRAERDTSRLSFHRRHRERLNRQPVRQYLKEVQDDSD